MLGTRINKFLLRTIGGLMPNKRHPLGKLGNCLRVHFARNIAKHVGKHCLIEKGAEILEDVVLNDYSSVGVNCLISKGTIINGSNMMGPHVHVYTSSHYYDETNHKFNGVTSIRPVIIGKNTWIGYGAIILPGVHIGDNSIIGAGSVVTKSVPPGVMAAGNPCIVKKIIDKKIYQDWLDGLEKEDK